MPGEQVEVERFVYEATRDIAASDTALPGEPLERAVTPWLSSPGGKVRAARGAQGERILLSHDAQGRVVERRVERNGFRPRVWRYGWNALDRLVSCLTPEGERWAYGYDPFGRRLWKRRVSGPEDAGVERAERSAGEAYLWDADVVVQAAPLYADGTVAWDRAVSWHHEPGTFRPIAREQGGGVYHVVTDHLGTPRELYDADGHRAWSRSHRLWGETRGFRQPENDSSVSFAVVDAGHDGEPADRSCPIGFPGQWWDDESGLRYNRFRHYDAGAGQYAVPDPIGLEGGTRPQGYVDNATVWFDPLGLVKCEETVKQAKSYEDARNQALRDIDKRGGLDPSTREATQAKNLGGDNPAAGQTNGFRGRTPSGEPINYRLDYDANKGPHINVQVGKGPTMLNNAYTFPGTQQDYLNLLRQFQR